MATNAPSTVRAQHFRERRSRGEAMVAPVEVGEGGIDILIRNELLNSNFASPKEHCDIDSTVYISRLEAKPIGFMK